MPHKKTAFLDFFEKRRLIWHYSIISICLRLFFRVKFL